MFIGIPGIGKTTIGKLLTKSIPFSEYIDQDQFFGERNASFLYLQSIEKTIKEGRIPILGKNHHNQKTRKPVIDLLKRLGVDCFAFNLLPDDFLLHREKVIDEVIRRIGERDPSSSTLHTDQARNVINDVFVPQYEKPEELSVIMLDYTSSVTTNVNRILEYIKEK